MICPACLGESVSHRDRTKPSTCKDCFSENPIFSKPGDFRCDCNLFDHDRSKIPPLPPMPAETKAAFESIAKIMDEKPSEFDSIYYQWKEDELLELQEWVGNKLKSVKSV